VAEVTNGAVAAPPRQIVRVGAQLSLMDALTAYLIVNIAAYLQHRGRAAMRATCRLFRDLIDETPSLYPERLVCCSPDKYTLWPGNSRNYAELRMKLDVLSFVRVPARCRNVRSLYVPMNYGMSTSDGYRMIPSSCYWGQCGFMTLLKVCLWVEHLSVHNLWLHDDSISGAMGRCVKTLEIYFDPDCPLLPTPMIDQCLFLTSLYLSNCAIRSAGEQCGFVFPRVPCLQILGLDRIHCGQGRALPWIEVISTMGETDEWRPLHLIIGTERDQWAWGSKLEELYACLQSNTFKRVTIAQVHTTCIHTVSTALEMFADRGLAMEMACSVLAPRTVWLDATPGLSTVRHID